MFEEMFYIAYCVFTALNSSHMGNDKMAINPVFMDQQV